MIGRIRRKFIGVTMISVVLVLAALMTILNILNYSQIDQEAGELVAFLAENGGVFPEAWDEEGQTEEAAIGEITGTASNEASDAVSGEASGEASGEMSDEAFRRGEKKTPAEPGRELLPPIYLRFTEETPYETRFFSVVLGPDGALVSADTEQIAAVTEDQAEALARQLQAEGQREGYSGHYKYLARLLEDGSVQYVFLDRSGELDAARKFLQISLLVSLCGIVVFFLLVLVLSGWVIRPMAASYDKQKQFITNAGHEIKTPLSVISSCTEVLELEQGENRWTSGIRDQVERLNGMTGDLIALARMDEGHKLARQDFDLSLAVEEELEAFRVLAEQRGYSLALDIQPGLQYRGNESELRHLVSILGDNGVKYTAPEGEIRFRLFRKGRKILLVGENPAPGFQPGEQPQLFERFYRGDESHNSEKTGYGIGLSMAESIVTAHGGRISAFSPDGMSLTISVQL